MSDKSGEWAKSGTIRIDFSIDSKGRVKNLRVLDHTGGHVSEDIARDAIEHASLPPIPKPLIRQLHTPDLECDVKFVVTED
jgi:outer membrane biosynthesis protein TonB